MALPSSVAFFHGIMKCASGTFMDAVVGIGKCVWQPCCCSRLVRCIGNGSKSLPSPSAQRVQDGQNGIWQPQLKLVLENSSCLPIVMPNYLEQ